MHATIKAWLFIMFATCSLTVGLSSAGMNLESLSDEVKKQLALPTDIKCEGVLIATSPDERYTEKDAKVNAPDIVALEA